jgi:hypothetical protein
MKLVPTSQNSKRTRPRAGRTDSSIAPSTPSGKGDNLRKLTQVEREQALLDLIGENALAYLALSVSASRWIEAIRLTSFTSASFGSERTSIWSVDFPRS